MSDNLMIHHGDTHPANEAWKCEECKRVLAEYQDLESVLSMLSGETDRQKVKNYIDEYLLKNIRLKVSQNPAFKPAF